MPQDGDVSTLITLLWAAWIYWSISAWLEHLSSLAVDDEQRRQRAQSGQSAQHQDKVRSIASPSADSTAGPNLEARVSEILRRDGAASVEDFLSNALVAYEAIVAAFDAGDRKTLRSLVSADVYDAFSQADIGRRETVFSQIDPPQIVDALIEDTHMEVSVRFLSEVFTLSRNATGRSMGEAPVPCRNVDTWTFARALPSRDSMWRLVATDGGEIACDSAELQ